MTRGELVTDILAWSKRDDAIVVMDSLIRLTEARIAQEVRAQEMVTVASVDTSQTPIYDNAWPLPADYLEMIDVSTGTGRKRTLRAVGRDEINARSYASGSPSAYSVYDGVIEVRPGPQEMAVNLIYYGRLAPLVGDDDSNALLVNYPALYLYGALTELWNWAQEAEERQVANSVYEREKNRINLQSWNARSGTAPQARDVTRYHGGPSRL